MNIHKRILELQCERNWSTNHMALEADISSGTIFGWFKKNSMPTVDGLRKICNAFGISLSQFFQEETSPTYLTDFQKEFLDEFDLLHNREKEDILRLIKTINDVRKNSNPQ